MIRFNLTLVACFITVICFGQQEIPYSSSFENLSDTVGWSHYALSGEDDWIFGIPNTPSFNSAHTGVSVAVTNLNSNAASYSNRALETPSFDLTSATEDLLLSFYHRTYFVSNSSVDFFMEYSTDQGATWSLLSSPTNQQMNWQTGGGFYNISAVTYEYSAISLDFLQSESDVRFRYRFTNSQNSDRGWMIDDFSIRPSYLDIEAQLGDTLWGINSYFQEVPIVMNLAFNSDFNSNALVKSLFYLSQDTLLDSSDILVDSVTHTISTSSHSLDIDVHIPQGLSSGYQYIIYHLNADNSINESSETNNTSYATIKVDSIYQPPYNDDFEGEEINWGTGPFAHALNMAPKWLRGSPADFHVEHPRSGQTGWHTGQQSNGRRLESPLFDLSQSADNVFCFWYRSTNTAFTNLQIFLPAVENELGTFNNYTNNADPTVIRKERHYGWDCHCHDFQRPDFRFMMIGHGSWEINSHHRNIFDDVYLGPALPDLAIESEKIFLFSSVERQIDTLHYKLFNGGLTSAPSSVTAFYWSTDSLLDAGDQLLGTQVEPSIPDTSFLERSFVYQKPTSSEGLYYIIYILDENEAIEEMWENDNVGIFRIEQWNLAELPYANDFETNADYWTSMSTLGNNDWRWKAPDGAIFNAAFSGSKALVTSDTGMASHTSRMHLMTPIFDLTQLNNPVMEFNLRANYFGAGYNNPNIGTLFYSIDGGYRWQIVDSTSQSIRRWYYRIEMDNHSGVDRWNGKVNTHLTYGADGIFQDSRQYQGRNFDDTYKVSIELRGMKNETQVRFMLIYANTTSDVEGMMFDDFRITEGLNDLKVVSDKSLMASSGDTYLHTDLVLKNDANYLSEATSVEILLSQDDTLGLDDLLLSSHAVTALRPYEKFYFNIADATPSDYWQYKYLLVNVDPLNAVNESDETNNLTALPLSMDTCETFTLPLTFDFEDEYINGWTWQHDSTGLYFGFRFRTQTVIGEQNYSAESGMYFLDHIDRGGYNADVDNFPTYYLESPSFDFTAFELDSVAFDLLCMGRTGSSTEGGNIQYSLNGIDWDVLGYKNDPTTYNWFDFASVETLDNEPGWVQKYNLQHCSKNIADLSGEPFVKFRFRFKSSYRVFGPGAQGLRLDNFTLTGNNLYTLIDELYICPGDSVQVFNEFVFDTGLYLDTLISNAGTDSIVAIQVQGSPSYNVVVDYDVCYGEPFTFPNGELSPLLFNNTMLSQTFPAFAYCDSVINYNISISQINTALTVSAGQVSAQNGNATYQWLDCANGFSVIDGETAQLFTPLINGSYAVMLSENGCVDTSDCVAVIVTGIEEAIGNNMFPYPNPTDGRIQISIPAADPSQWVTIRDSRGRAIKRISLLRKGQVYIDLPKTNGLYLLEFANESGVVHVFQVFKN